MKRLLAFILAFTMLSTTVVFADGDAIKYTRRKNKTDEAWLWDELSKHSPSDVITAAVLSYFWRESQYRSDAIAGWATTERALNIDICKVIREKVDKGLEDGSSRKYFIKKVRECGGYGLGQWYSLGYLKSLYSFARDYGTSIGDARMQCAFIFYSLQENEKLWKKLKKCTDPERAGRLIGIYYDGTEHGAPYMGYKAGRLYEKYAKESEG